MCVEDIQNWAINLFQFNLQCRMFRSTYQVDSLSDAFAVFKKMVPEVRGMFVAVEQLVRLMLVCLCRRALQNDHLAHFGD
jgi:hypothetical protein